MLNTKYIVLVDDTKELCELVAELYENEIDYELTPTNLKLDIRLVGIFLLILSKLTTIIKLDFRLVGGVEWHIFKEQFQRYLKAE